MDFEDKISKHWPEFAQNGKENLTVEQLMRHEAGLMTMRKQIDLEWCTAENIKKNKVGEVLENEYSVWGS